MILQQHVVNVARPPTASQLISGPYPIGMSQEKFMDLFADVKSLEGAGYASTDSTLAQNINSTDIVGALQVLNEFNAADTNSSFVGASTRRIVPIGQLEDDGDETRLSATPTVLANYPVHRLGSGGGGYCEIDFGRSVMYQGVFYPRIEVVFSNGMGNLVGGFIVGGIDFEGYGIIPIYGGPLVDGVVRGFASGRIAVVERYSQLRASARASSVGRTLRFESEIPLERLDRYKRAFFGPYRTPVVASLSSLEVIVPPNAKSGPVRFESDSPLYDNFLSYDEIRIS